MRWREFLLNRFYPSHCLLCDAVGMIERNLCHGCFADLPWNLHTCPLCALPLPEESSLGSLCGKCQKKMPPFDACFAPLRYESEVALLVGGFKFRNRLEYGKLLGQILANHLKSTHHEWPELILPVPLHKSRLHQRGYNQSLVIGRQLGRLLAIPVEHNALKRSRKTVTQSSLNYTERHKNIRNAFTLAKPLPARSVALLDDVVTTGETVAELSRLLKKRGIQHIEVWALARTP